MKSNLILRTHTEWFFLGDKSDDKLEGIKAIKNWNKKDENTFVEYSMKLMSDLRLFG